MALDFLPGNRLQLLENGAEFFPALLRAIDAALDQFEADPAIACVAVTGAGERGLCAGHAPIVNCVAAGLLQAETMVRLHQLNGLQPNRGPFCAQAGAQAIADFRGLLARHQTGKDTP